jgi:hypothetical protein
MLYIAALLGAIIKSNRSAEMANVAGNLRARKTKIYPKSQEFVASGQSSSFIEEPLNTVKTMNDRGRPKNDGRTPFWVLERETCALYAYQNCREQGEKHSVAVQDAVAYIREKYLGKIRISETEVKRIIARWRPRGAPVGLSVTKPDPKNNVVILPGGREVKILYTAAWGPRKEYRRVNSIEKSQN